MKKTAGDILANSLLAIMAAFGVYFLLSALIFKRINISFPNFWWMVAEIAIVGAIAVWGLVRVAGNIRQAKTKKAGSPPGGPPAG